MREEQTCLNAGQDPLLDFIYQIYLGKQIIILMKMIQKQVKTLKSYLIIFIFLSLLYNNIHNSDQNRKSIILNLRILIIDMNRLFESASMALPTREIMVLIRVYVVNFLAYQFGIEKFSQDSINCISSLIFNFISSIVLQIKNVVNSQGRTIPNILHLMAVFVKLNLTLDDLITYLDQKYDQQKFKKSEQILWKYQVKNAIQTRLKQQFKEEIIESQNPNIISIPQMFTQSLQKPAECLPIRRPIDELLPKPPIYTFKQDPFFIQTKDSKENIAKKSVSSQNQMRLALSKHRRLHSNQTVYEIEDSVKRNEKYGSGQKFKFNFVKYL